MKKEIIDFFQSEHKLQNIVTLFTPRFLDVYNQMRGPQKTLVLECAQTLFKKWYYSTLVDETVLSPANLINHRFRQAFGDTYMIAPKLIPQYSRKKLSGFDFALNVYTIEDHPILNDLSLLLETCTPDVELNEEDMLSETPMFDLLPKLSIQDIFYANFLIVVAFELKLIKKMRSINTNRGQTTKTAESFLRQNPRQQLEKIIDAAIQIAAKKLSEILPNRNNIFSPRIIRSFLQEPLDLDSIYRKVCSSLGIDIERVWALQEDDSEFVDEVDEMILSSSYFLGVMLDLWFLTPFGYYLQIIQPLYFFSYRFKEEMDTLYEEADDEEDMASSLFSPSTYYDLTPLGTALFNDASYTGLQALKDNITFDDLYDALMWKLNKVPFETTDDPQDILDTSGENIYELKVKFYHHKRTWQVIEISANQTLHDLHEAILECFDLDPYHLYSFFMSNRLWDAISEYTHPQNPGKKRKATAVKLRDLGLSIKQKFLYLYDFGDEICFEVEVINQKVEALGKTYPQVTRKSKDLQS